MKKLYTCRGVAEITGYSFSTIQVYARTGEIKGDKYKGRWRFTEEQIKEFLDKKKKEGEKWIN